MTETIAEPIPGMPTWVKVFIVAGIMLALTILVVLLVGGEHGPARHLDGESLPWRLRD